MIARKRAILKMSALWLALALLALLVLALRLQLNFDLSVFFPHKTSLSHDILLEQLKNGPGSRLIVIGLSGPGREQLEESSGLMKEALADNPAFVNVLNGDYEIENSVIPEPLDTYYLLLGDIDYSKSSLQQSLQLRIQDLAFGGGSSLSNLISKDPFLQTLAVLQRLVPVNRTGEMWFAEDGSAVLLAETRAAGVDISAQESAILAVRQAFSDLSVPGSFQLEITGVGAFGVELQKTIRAEAKKRTTLAIGVLLLVLFLVYRKLRLVLLAALPLSMGFLVGLAVVALVFDSVHGITLAFGFTLMGIAIDYPLHLFSHARHRSGRMAIESIWPTLRIGASSTAIAYLAIAFSGSKGLAQLGIFTASGVVTAALATRSWLPLLVGQQAAEADSGSRAKPQGPSLIFVPAILTLVLALVATHYWVKGELWEDRLSSLSPVPHHRLLADGRLRSAAGSPDMRYQLVFHAPTLEELLRESEAIDLLLEDAVKDGLLDSWQSISQVLPSQPVQRDRQLAIPDSDILRDRLSEVLADTPFRDQAFAPFEDAARVSKTLSLLLPEHFKGTPLSSWMDSHLIQIGDRWISLVTMSNPQPQELAARIKTWGKKLDLVDLQQSSLDLVRDYREGAITAIILATFAIIALLLFEQRKIRRIAWIVVTVSAALSVTVTAVTSMHAGLTIIHLVALLLVLGLGLDYALFLSRTESDSDQAATRHAVVACAVTTTLTFSILAASSIPVLKFMGLTIAVGSATSFVLAFAGSWMRKKPLSRNGD